MDEQKYLKRYNLTTRRIFIFILVGLILFPSVANAFFIRPAPKETVYPSFKLIGTVPVTQLGVSTPTDGIKATIKGSTWQSIFKQVLPSGWRVYALEGPYLYQPVNLDVDGQLPAVLEQIAKRLSVRFILDWNTMSVFAAPAELERQRDLQAANNWLDGERARVTGQINTHVWPSRTGWWKFFHRERAATERAEYYGLIGERDRIIDDIVKNKVALKQLEDDLDRVGPLHVYTNEGGAGVVFNESGDISAPWRYNVVPVTGKFIITEGQGGTMNRAILLTILILAVPAASAGADDPDLGAIGLDPSYTFTDAQKEYYATHPEAAGLIESTPEVAQQITFLRQTALMESGDSENYRRELTRLQRLIKARLVELMIEDGIDPGPEDGE